MIKQLVCISACLAISGWTNAQQCEDSIDETTPTTRFVLNGDGTVTDSRSDLRWQRCPVGYELDDNGTAAVLSDDRCNSVATTTFNWQGALQSASDLNDSGGFAGFADWRVPNLKELASIVEFKCLLPAVNATLFPDTPPSEFWSSSTPLQINSALVVNFETGVNYSSFLDAAGFENYVRLVRGGG